MIGIVLSGLLAMVVMALLLGLPGWAIARLLELQLAVPTLLLPPAWFAFGLTTWTLAVLPCLTFGWPWVVMFGIHAVVTVVLVTCAVRRDRRRGVTKSGGGMVAPWTVAGIALCFLLAAALRTRMAFDTLFHLGLVRRLLELPNPTFWSLDRVLDAGVNPSYVIPAWQAAMAAVAGVTGLDPATVVESMAALIVVIAACSAAGLGRVVTGTAAGEVAGVAAYAWTRVYFPRRELEGDGIAYAMAPGNVALDVLLPLALATALILVQRRAGDPAARRGSAIAVGAVASVLIVVLHANYAVFLAILGVGMVAWLFVVGPWSREVRRRARTSILTIGLPGVVALIALLPVLTRLDHFADPLEERINYHLIGSGSWQIIRPGHLYDWYAVAGLIGTLLLPYAVWRAPRMARALIGGGALAICAVALIPPLLTLLGQTGSLTLGLRLSRPFGIVLIAAYAVAIPALVTDVRALAARARTRGAWLARDVVIAPFALTFLLAFVYGYPLARREPPQYGWNWPTLVAVAVLIVVAALLARRRRSTTGITADSGYVVRDTQGVIRPKVRQPATVVGWVVLVLAICMLPSGIVSLRRGGWQARQLVAATRADDLGCYSAVQLDLRRLDPGTVILTDPMTSYGAQALGPVYTLADFKTWNGRTDADEVERRIGLLRTAFDRADPVESAAGLQQLRARYHARYVLLARHAVQPPLDSTIGAFDARGLREALESGDIPAREIAAGQGKLPGHPTTEDRGACDLELWELT